METEICSGFKDYRMTRVAACCISSGDIAHAFLRSWDFSTECVSPIMLFFFFKRFYFMLVWILCRLRDFRHSLTSVLMSIHDKGEVVYMWEQLIRSN